MAKIIRLIVLRNRALNTPSRKGCPLYSEVAFQKSLVITLYTQASKCPQ